MIDDDLNPLYRPRMYGKAITPMMWAMANDLIRLRKENEAFRFALQRIAGRADAQAAWRIAHEALRPTDNEDQQG